MAFLATVIAAVVVAGGCARHRPVATGAREGPVAAASPQEGPNPLRNAYFGDLHVHTAYSFDAYLFGTRTTPDDAYRYARGEAIQHAAGFAMQLAGGPLDFEAVTDHAEFLGVLQAMADPTTELSHNPLAAKLVGATTVEASRDAFRALLAVLGPHGDGQPPPELLDHDAMRRAWLDIIAAAERNYEPGRFTTFIAFEYTSGPDSQNLHRNVIYRGSAVPDVPFSRFDSQNPEDLWAWMDAQRAVGMEALGIPHNSNGSNGQMFRLATFEGEALDAPYAADRMLNEPLVEVTQVKGTSETHPVLSPNDEWTDFEIFPYRISTTIPSEPHGSYVREAYLNGLVMEDTKGFNPFRFGLIGSTDTHNSASPVDESNFFGKVGVHDATPVERGSVPMPTPVGGGPPQYGDLYPYRLFSASGLAGVWAEENTREAIFDALRRKETFATSGPRIRVRFFAGFEYPEDLLAADDMIAMACAKGVPMGGDLVAAGERSPRFLVWATRDPNSAPLQRLQIIKGWVEHGVAAEQVFDVACSDGLQPDPTTYRCPDNGATVDLEDCSYSQDRGAAELTALWSDPHFNPGQRAIYYVRVLEDPTCRWSTWDAVRAGVPPREGVATTIQERAWSSPIWYRPSG